MPSRKELQEIMDLMQIAMMQPRQEDAGKDLFKVRHLLTKHHLTLAEVYKHHDNDNYNDSTVSQPKVNQSENDLLDPTDIWARPWARKMEQGASYLRPRDAEHLVVMQSKRTHKPRTLNDIEWLFQIARRTQQKDTVPPEALAWLREHGSEEVLL